MAETLLSFGVEKLWDLLARESERFQGVEDQFNKLKSEVKTLRSFLEDADAKKHSSARLKNIVNDIKEIVYDGEDILETFFLKEEHGKTSIRKRIRQLADGRGLSYNMEALSKRIATVNRDMQCFGVQQFTVNVREIQREIRQTFASDIEDHLVGLEKNVEQLVGYLVEEASTKVVSIIGMGGIGKTTLARQVINHEMVKKHFDGVAWVCISQQFTATYVWQTILQKLSSKHDEQITETRLQEELYQLLETSNSLIVIDDMWKEEDWDRIKHAFPKKDPTWKVLLTSRNEDVALHADPTCVIFKPDCLTPEESWTLFQRIAFPRIDTSKEEVKVDVEKMEDMGKQMIKDCGGLPLAIRVLGGLLAAKHTLSEWKRIYENTGSRIVGGISEENIGHVNHILSLSYEELPIYLKQCFLYLAHFPEDSQISVEDLSYYWAAEGIPRPRYYHRATIQEVGDGYIEELVRRNMVISERVATTSRFETCQLHDMMREVCLLKAHEENFLQIFDATATSLSPCISRRIAVHQLDRTSPPKWKILNPKLRSLFFYYEVKGYDTWMATGLSFKRVQLMRVLDLSWAKFKGRKLPSSIGKLIHLRYLSLYRAEVHNLPSSMKNLKLLLYLNLEFNPLGRRLYMPPNIFKEMRKLTYLSLPRNIHKVKLELGNQVNLERLFNFSTEHCSVRDLHRMTRLTTLKIRFYGKGVTMNTLSSSLSELRNLESLTIDGPRHGDGIEGFVFDCGIHVKHLTVGIYMRKLPDEQHFSSHLTILTLVGCRLVEDPMPILEKLLHLNEVNLMSRSFAGRRMVCSGGGFPQLHTLKLFKEELEEWIVEKGSMPLLHTLTISFCGNLKQLPVGRFPQLHTLELFKLEEWEEWILEEGSMPLLHTLDIWKCPKLKQLPDKLQFISSLKNLSIDKEWKEKLSEGGEEYYKIQHIPLVQFSGIRSMKNSINILFADYQFW